MRTTTIIGGLVVLASLPAAARGAVATRLVDATTQEGRPGGGIDETGFIASAGGRAWFWGWDEVHGTETWVTDGTAATTRRVERNGGELHTSYGAAERVAVGARLVFSGWDGGHGLELLVADAAPDGTAVFADFNPGPSGSTPSDLVALSGGRVFAMAWTPADGREPRLSDGTPGGTLRLANIEPDTPDRVDRGRSPRYAPRPAAVAIGDLVVFTADDGVAGREPWVSDGTPGGTAILLDAEPGSAGSDPQVIASSASAAWLVARTAGIPSLWRTDGTPSGTVRTSLGAPLHLLTVGARAYVVASDAWGTMSLFVTDGTPAGTTRLAEACDHCPTPWIARAPPLAELGNGLIAFAGFDVAAGAEPWVTDGTLAGTRRIADVVPGPEGMNPAGVAGGGGAAWFLSAWGPHVRTDGTTGGTVVDAWPRWEPCSDPFVLGDDLLVGVTEDAWTQCEPQAWRPDGSFEALADVQPATSASHAFPLASSGGLLLFEASEGWAAPWDGAVAGGLTDDAGGALDFHGVLGPVSGGVLVRARARTGRPDVAWVTDGTAAGTRSLGAFAEMSRTAAPLGDRILFGARDGVQVSRGTAATTTTLHGAGGDGFVRVGAEVAFFSTAAFETSLFLTDGTIAGTREVASAAGVAPDFSDLWGPLPPVVGPDGRVYVLMRAEGETVLSPWRWDPASGDVLRLAPACHDLLTAFAGGVLVAIAGDDAPALTVVRPDATLETLVPEWHPAFIDRFSVAVAPAGVVFSHADTASGSELWVTDGTPGGTRRLADIHPGSGSSHPTYVQQLVPGGLVQFTADDGASGREPWWTDGTAAGTLRVADVVPGPGSSNPRHATVAGSKACFSADDGTGREVWCVPFANADESSSCLDGADQDGDGLVDCADDDCAGLPACASRDADGDGAPNGDDCAPLDPLVQAVPREIDALEVAHVPAGSGVILDWEDREPGAGGVVYDVARGLLSELAPAGAPATCLVRDWTFTAYLDPDTAPAGDGFYWLVKARNACGPPPGEGWGLDGLGAPTPACP